MYMEEEHGISPHMLNSTSLVCNVSLFVFSSQLLFRFLLSPLQFLLSLLLFLFSSLLSRFFFYYWAQSCNSLSWRHLCLTDGTMLKSQFRQPSKYLMLRICFNILCNITFEICCDCRRDAECSASFEHYIRLKWRRKISALEWQWAQVGQTCRPGSMLIER